MLDKCIVQTNSALCHMMKSRHNTLNLPSDYCAAELTQILLEPRKKFIQTSNPLEYDKRDMYP